MIRPGRVDMKELIGWASAHQLEQMYMRFYPQESRVRAAAFAQKVKENGQEVSAAQVQGFFMFHKSDPQTAIKNAHMVATV